MWKCKKCGEENEDAFDSCWNCGTSIDGTQSVDINEFKSIKENELKSIKEDVVVKRDTFTNYTTTYGTARMIAQFVFFRRLGRCRDSVLILFGFHSQGSRDSFAMMVYFLLLRES